MLGLAIFGQPRFSSSMLPCPRLPEHLIQVPDLIDLALPVLFGGRWHILQTSAQVNIQENKSHCLVQSKFDMHCEATSLARTLSSGLRCKMSIFRATFRAPRKRFFGPPILHFFGSFCGLGGIWSHFSGPRKYFSGWNSGPWKGIGGSNFGQSRTEENKRHLNDWN